MKITEIMNLKEGTEVFWNDPSNTGSRVYKILEINFYESTKTSSDSNPLIVIIDEDGSEIRCTADELSLNN